VPNIDDPDRAQGEAASVGHFDGEGPAGDGER
jgi:hypothetical protein